MHVYMYIHTCMSFPGGSDDKASAYNAGDPGSIPGSGRSPGEGNGNPLQYSCLEKSHGWRNLVGFSPWGHKESDTTERLHLTLTHMYVCVHAQSCLILCDPMDWSLPGSSVHGIFQTRRLEWAAISYSRGSSQARDWTRISCVSRIGRWILYCCITHAHTHTYA